MIASENYDRNKTSKLVNSFSSSNWINNWKNNEWLTSNNKPVKNYELWKKIDFYNTNLNINWHWVKGHSGNKYNEKVDKIAQIEALKFK